MSKGERQRTARDRLAEERRRRAAREKQRRLLLFVLGGVVALAAVVAVTVVAINAANDRDQKGVAYGGPAVPVTRQADGSTVAAKAGVTAPTVEVYEDFQCPACKNFEDESGDTLLKLAAEGRVRVVFRPFNLFQQEPLKGVSRRGANAALCTPADKWLSYHQTLFEHQPREGQEGFTNENLINWAKDLGFGDETFEKCVTGMQKSAQLDEMTQYAVAQQVESTPTVRLNGKGLQGEALTSEGLEKAVRAAASTPSPSGSATPKQNG